MASGCMMPVAARLITARTVAPRLRSAWMSLTVSTAAILPQMPMTTVFPERGGWRGRLLHEDLSRDHHVLDEMVLSRAAFLHSSPRDSGTYPCAGEEGDEVRRSGAA